MGYILHNFPFPARSDDVGAQRLLKADTYRCHRPSAVQGARHDDGVFVLHDRNPGVVEVRGPYLVGFA